MCLQDFQMGRRTQTVVHQPLVGAVNLPPNPSRLRLVVSVFGGVVGLAFGDNTNGNLGYAVLVGNIDSGAVVQYSMTELIRLEDYGSALLGQVSTVEVNSPSNWAVTEVVALPDLDRLISGGK